MVQRALEEHLYFGALYIMWFEDDAFHAIAVRLFADVPWLLRGYVSRQVRKKIVRDLQGQVRTATLLTESRCTGGRRDCSAGACKRSMHHLHATLLLSARPMMRSRLQSMQHNVHLQAYSTQCVHGLQPCAEFTSLLSTPDLAWAEVHGKWLQGLARHTREEVRARLEGEVAALNTLLDDSEFLTGTTPCQADCFLFAMMEQVRMWEALTRGAFSKFCMTACSAAPLACCFHNFAACTLRCSGTSGQRMSRATLLCAMEHLVHRGRSHGLPSLRTTHELVQAMAMLKVGPDGSSHHLLGILFKEQPNLMRFYNSLRSTYCSDDGASSAHWKRTLPEVLKAGA